MNVEAQPTTRTTAGGEREARDTSARERAKSPAASTRDLRDELNVCAFCGDRSSFEAPLTWSTWGFGFVSDPFPAHRGCAEDYGTDALKEQE